jgi:hypothetical protein
VLRCMEGSTILYPLLKYQEPEIFKGSDGFGIIPAWAGKSFMCKAKQLECYLH